MLPCRMVSVNIDSITFRVCIVRGVKTLYMTYRFPKPIRIREKYLANSPNIFFDCLFILIDGLFL